MAKSLNKINGCLLNTRKMHSNELCKKLNEMSHKRRSIPESQRYCVHFDYHDLVSRLLKLKKELNPEPKPKSKPYALSINLKSPSYTGKTLSKLTVKSKSKKALDGIYSTKVKKIDSEKALPDLRSPLSKVSPKNLIPGMSEKVLKTSKASYDFKLFPRLKRKSIHN